MSNQTSDPEPLHRAKDESLKQYLIDEFVEDYQEGKLTRREALKRLLGLTTSLALANSILAACAPPATRPSPTAVSTLASAATPTSAQPAANAADDVHVSPDDPAIQAATVQFPGQGATLSGYLARPKGDAPIPLVLVCHENRGLTDHIQDVTRRVAKAGYAGLAVDLLSRQGGSDRVDAAQVPGVLGNAPPQQLVQDFQAGLDYLKTQNYARKDSAGMVGFCFGGGVTWRCATQIADLRAAVPFYGPNPPLDEVPKIQAAVFAIYGELDTRIDAGIPAIEAAMKQNNKTFEKMIYPNANHAFHNDTGASYNPTAARDAWAKTLAWFEKYLEG